MSLDGATSADRDLLADLVDFVLPVLPPYEFSLYVLLLVRSQEGGRGEVRIGKRTIALALGKGTRASHGNYQHITEKLVNLEREGFITIGDTDRLGTRYRVALPYEVPKCRELIAAKESPAAAEELDYFTDPVLRRGLFERDAWRCRYCGEAVAEGTATLDHVNPRSNGGVASPDNLWTACLMCNSIKSGLSYEQAAPKLLESIAGRRARDGAARTYPAEPKE